MIELGLKEWEKKRFFAMVMGLDGGQARGRSVIGEDGKERNSWKRNNRVWVFDQRRTCLFCVGFGETRGGSSVILL